MVIRGRLRFSPSLRSEPGSLNVNYRQKAKLSFITPPPVHYYSLGSLKQHLLPASDTHSGWSMMFGDFFSLSCQEHLCAVSFPLEAFNLLCLSLGF